MNNSLSYHNTLTNHDILIVDVIEVFVQLKQSNNTQRSYRNDIIGFFNHVDLILLVEFAQLPFPTVVDSIQKYLAKNTKKDELTNRVLNPATVNRKAYALSAFFKYLINVYGYPKNPINQFSPLKTDRKSSTTSLTRSEMIDLLAFSKSEHRISQTKFRNYLIMVFLFALALRREEVVNITWGDIDLENNKINIYQKGGSYKLLPLPLSIISLLNEFKKAHPSDCLYVFHPVRNNRTQELNKPIRSSYVFEMVKKIAFEVVPDKKITPHSFRKTFIELALNNKEDFINITNATGHSTVEMIKYYDTRDSLKNNAIHSVADIV
jgi:integrase/recombinase XerD